MREISGESRFKVCATGMIAVEGRFGEKESGMKVATELLSYLHGMLADGKVIDEWRVGYAEQPGEISVRITFREKRI